MNMKYKIINIEDDHAIEFESESENPESEALNILGYFLVPDYTNKETQKNENAN
jgi:hypothetical protein